MPGWSLTGPDANIAKPAWSLTGPEKVPSSGVTIAPKGGMAREATSEEAGKLDYVAASAGDVGSKAVENFVPSAQKFGQDIYHVVSDPIGTAKNLTKTVSGAVEKLIPGEQGNEPYADAVGQFFANRYGSMEALKQTIAEDPVGFAADVATILTGGELALARAPGVAGQIGRAAGTASRAVDPIAGSLGAAKMVGKGVGAVSSTVSGVVTGAGGQAVREAARAGFEGGERGAAFTSNMRGTVPMDEVVADAKSALDAIKAQRQSAYQAGMADVKADPSVLDFKKIDATLAGAKPPDGIYKGRSGSGSVIVDPAVVDTVGKIKSVLEEWRGLDPKEFHTAEGFDALKQSIDSIRDGTKPGSASEKLATQVRNIVKDQITAQAPSYAKTMKGYQEASELIKEIEKTLSQNRNASVDTKLRKLQSVMRNNVNTNYGKRLDLVKLLEANGANLLLSKLAGQSLSSAAPRGLAGSAGALGGIGQVAGGVMTMNPLAIGTLAGQAAIQSPRIAGEVAYAGGRAANALSRVPVRNSLMVGYQTERIHR